MLDLVRKLAMLHKIYLYNTFLFYLHYANSLLGQIDFGRIFPLDSFISNGPGVSD